MTSPLADLINRAKFYLNRVRGFDSVKGRIPHKKEKLPLTHGLNYRLACDTNSFVTLCKSPRGD